MPLKKRGRERIADEGHQALRTAMRVIGPCLFLLGLGFTIVGIVDYVAHGTKDAVRDVASAMREGLGDAPSPTLLRCYKCNADNELPANFCKGCGVALTKTKACPSCRELNDPDARFCDNCGTAIRERTPPR